MTDRPIIFSAPMVRALLDGRKTQTRRLVKSEAGSEIAAGDVIVRWGPDFGGQCARFRPSYAPGDRLYVREAWCGHLGPILDGLRQRTIHYHEGERVLSFYKADDATLPFAHSKWRPAIHMPRWASRLTLTVTEVRVQRLQEISEEDARAEGVGTDRTHTLDCGPVVGAESVFDGTFCADHRDAMRHAWQTLHGAGSLAANPWVVAVSFTVDPRNIDSTNSH